jgi:hypothetical protein
VAAVSATELIDRGPAEDPRLRPGAVEMTWSTRGPGRAGLAEDSGAVSPMMEGILLGLGTEWPATCNFI